MFSLLFDWWPVIAAALAAWLIAKIVQNDVMSPLAKIPGPWCFLQRRFDMVIGIVCEDAPHRFLRQYHKYGPIFRLDSDSVIVADVEAVRLLHSSNRFRKAEHYKAMEFHQDNIFSTRDVDYHRKMIRVVGPTFSNSSINGMEAMIYETGVEKLLDKVEKFATSSDTFDILQYITYMTLDIIGKVVFDSSFDLLLAEKVEEAEPPVIKWLREVSALGMLRYVLGPLCNRWVFPSHFASDKSLIEFARNAVRKCEEKAGQAAQESTQKTILYQLIKAEDPETGERLTEDQLIAESVIQIMAGTDTVALTTTWTLHLLLENPHTYQLLVKELCVALPDRNARVTHSQLKSLPYLNAVLYESMRILPVTASGNPKQMPPGGETICGHHIPEKYVVYPMTYIVHRMKEVYGPDPEEFRPGRWIDASAEQLDLMRRMFLGFSLGSRACVGQTLAWVELRLALATLLRRFDFHVPDDAKVDMTPVLQFTLRPRARQFLVKAEPRAM
ncbi:cytochrome P450 [Syncephalis pseudoplumigaleata]|uniref:Cytochrome P450 n=1 Tax=Syncephalis pseudoplumigaleata TaxID=1712513 RepID=A0A4P9Z4C1_9FUNG|nr:cytochrome P450 [Syncephalis pseudoplumigaleata]|eukprot:RKP27417.1 cytochrome P450 [Syncephalis pseudoplumigaleata]